MQNINLQHRDVVAVARRADRFGDVTARIEHQLGDDVVVGDGKPIAADYESGARGRLRAARRRQDSHLEQRCLCPRVDAGRVPAQLLLLRLCGCWPRRCNALRAGACSQQQACYRRSNDARNLHQDFRKTRSIGSHLFFFVSPGSLTWHASRNSSPGQAA